MDTSLIWVSKWPAAFGRCEDHNKQAGEYLQSVQKASRAQQVGVVPTRTQDNDTVIVRRSNPALRRSVWIDGRGLEVRVEIGAEQTNASHEMHVGRAENCDGMESRQQIRVMKETTTAAKSSSSDITRKLFSPSHTRNNGVHHTRLPAINRPNKQLNNSWVS